MSGCSSNCGGNSGGCVCEVVRFICNLQSQVKCHKRDKGCTRPVLGRHVDTKPYNTRPFILYLSDGSLFQAYINPNTQTPIFRVEKMEGCCCRLRALRLVGECGEPILSSVLSGKGKIVCTDHFVTLNLECCCGIQCLEDIRLDCI